MSAFLCDAPHLSACADILLQLACQPWWDGPALEPGETPADLFAMLLRENLLSIGHRYPGDDEMQEASVFHLYQPQEVGNLAAAQPVIDRDRAAALKALQCYAYQACEHPGWRTSRAWAMVKEAERLLAQAITRHVQAVADARWGWSPRPLSPARRS